MTDEDKAYLSHQRRRRYLLTCPPAKLDAIIAQSMLMREKCPSTSIEDSLELAIHQQQLNDFIAKPRSKKGTK